MSEIRNLLQMVSPKSKMTKKGENYIFSPFVGIYKTNSFLLDSPIIHLAQPINNLSFSNPLKYN